MQKKSVTALLVMANSNDQNNGDGNHGMQTDSTGNGVEEYSNHLKEMHERSMALMKKVFPHNPPDMEFVCSCAAWMLTARMKLLLSLDYLEQTV